MPSIGSQNIAIRAQAAKRAWHVVTSKRALIAQFQAFVDVFANLISPGCEAFVAGALEAALEIRASPVTADAGRGDALVLIDATRASEVQDETCGAFATIRTVRIDALASGAHVGHEKTLVQVNSSVVATGALGAQLFELL